MRKFVVLLCPYKSNSNVVFATAFLKSFFFPFQIKNLPIASNKDILSYQKQLPLNRTPSNLPIYMHEAPSYEHAPLFVCDHLFRDFTGKKTHQQ